MGSSALTCAAAGGHTSVVHMLLSAGADVNNAAGTVAPLLLAAQGGLSLFCLFLFPSHLLFSPYLSPAGHESVVRLLLDKKAATDAKLPGSGWTPLMLAAQNGFLNIVQILVSHHSDVNEANSLQCTALDIASAFFFFKKKEKKKETPTLETKREDLLMMARDSSHRRLQSDQR